MGPEQTKRVTELAHALLQAAGEGEAQALVLVHDAYRDLVLPFHTFQVQQQLVTVLEALLARIKSGDHARQRVAIHADGTVDMPGGRH